MQDYSLCTRGKTVYPVSIGFVKATFTQDEEVEVAEVVQLGRCTDIELHNITCPEVY
jgi:hypothetical protein